MTRVSGETVAAFDFDGTITTRDTLVPFLAHVAGWTAVAGATAKALPGARTRNQFKERLLAETLGGRSMSTIEHEGRRYSRQVERHLRPAMVDQIEWHRRRGDRLVIVSASLHAYLDPVAEMLGVDDVLAVRLEVDEYGTLTGSIEGENVRQGEKVKRLLALLGEEPDQLWAYGDASGDADLLSLASHPVPVSRRAHRYATGER
jgi:phosphatidylglycerophosphatase C